MVKMASAARIIQKPEEMPRSSKVSPGEKDLFTSDELFGVKKGQYFKKINNRILGDIEDLIQGCCWNEIISLYHPVEEKTPELVRAGMALKIKGKIAFALGHLKRYDDAIAILNSCAEEESGNFLTHSSLAFTAYSSLFAAKNKEIFLAGKSKAQRIELAHKHFVKAGELRPDSVTTFYRQAMLYNQIQGKKKPALPLFSKAISNWEVLSQKEKALRHQEKKNYIKSLYRSAGLSLEAGNASKALEQIKTCLAQDEKSNHIFLHFKYFALGKVNFSIEQYDKAKQALRFSLQSCNKNQASDFVYELLARTYLAMGQLDQAGKTIDMVPEKQRRPYYRWTQADILCGTGQFKQAASVLINAASRDGRSKHIALVRLAKIYFSLDQYETGADYASQANAFFTEKWGNPYYEGLFWQTLCTFKSGQVQEALTLLCKLESHCPYYPKLNRLAVLIRCEKTD